MTLAELLANRREQLGMSTRDVADSSAGLVSKTTVAAIESGTMRVVSDRVLDGLAIALDLTPSRVYSAAHRRQQQLPPFTVPDRADRLNARERKLVLSLIDTLLAARDQR
jgi:transcriptional regulator with XRE-family HTH domain